MCWVKSLSTIKIKSSDHVDGSSQVNKNFILIDWRAWLANVDVAESLCLRRKPFAATHVWTANWAKTVIGRDTAFSKGWRSYLGTPLIPACGTSTRVQWSVDFKYRKPGCLSKRKVRRETSMCTPYDQQHISSAGKVCGSKGSESQGNFHEQALGGGRAAPKGHPHTSAHIAELSVLCTKTSTSRVLPH